MKDAVIAGVDEAGRGPLAGPVVAAVVILDPNDPIEGIRDSKKLSQKQREALYGAIIHRSLAYAVAHAEVAEIDEINILQASLLAMQRAVSALSIKPDKIYVDGRDCPDFSCPAEAIIQGDDLHLSIGAASILAKVERDRLMIEYEKQYPGYGFAQHKGYGTAQHLEALSLLGPSPIHRYSFAPVRACAHLREVSV